MYWKKLLPCSTFAPENIIYIPKNKIETVRSKMNWNRVGTCNHSFICIILITNWVHKYMIVIFHLRTYQVGFLS